MNEKPETVIIPTGCCHDCGGRCVLKAHVRDGRIVRIETDNGATPQLRACLRGRAYRQRVYSPDRLKYPLRRTGERGEGKFERVSWDEALDEVAARLTGIRNKYGNASILLANGSGNQGMLHGAGAVGRMLLNFGGYTRTWGVASFEGSLFASMATYGTIRTGNTRDDLLNSRMIIMWGWDPAVTIQDAGTSLYLAKAREKGIRIVAVDPRYTDSAATFSDQWIPIRPSTDAAMLNAMAYVIIDENLHDQAFIDKFTTGFEKYRDFLNGKEDGIARTPEWAAEITTVPAETIAALAREYAVSKPAALVAGWGPARTAMGEQYARAANVLTAITGNIGINGGYAAGFMRAYSSRERRGGPRPPNPVEAGAPARKDALYKLRGGTNPTSARIHSARIFDAILRGKAGSYPTDIKAAYVVAGNYINQNPNTNRGVQAFKSLEFVVVHEQFMTPTAKFGDIVLPVNTFMEREDMASAWLGSPCYVYLNRAIDPMYQAKSDLEICRDLSVRLGIPAPEIEPTDEERLREIASAREDIADFDSLKREGAVKIDTGGPVVSFRQNVEDPEKYPFPTLSGKIEIYSEHMAELKDPRFPPLPAYMTHWENYDDPLAEKYPLQLLTTHYKTRAHSTWHNVPWLQEIEPHSAWINSADAAARGIRDGDTVAVFNDRGRMHIPVKVTERIMPGVVNIGQGAWFEPDENGIDHGGCANVLTNDQGSPGGAIPMNTALVQVELVRHGDE